jgi:hypothetical protein
MGSLPGQPILIVISPGFLTTGQEASTYKSRIMDMAVQSNVTISALDARGLYTTELDASHRGANSARDLMTGATSEYHRNSMTLNEDVMAELADGTGGTFFHNSNDLESGFKQLTTVPEYLYLLEFSGSELTGATSVFCDKAGKEEKMRSTPSSAFRAGCSAAVSTSSWLMKREAPIFVDSQPPDGLPGSTRESSGIVRSIRFHANAVPRYASPGSRRHSLRCPSVEWV